MPVTLAIESDGTIPVKDLKDGQLAVITAWGNGKSSPYTGRIIQRFKDVLITIGMGSDEAWENLLTNHKSCLDCRVRVLKVGDGIMVTAN